MRAVLALTLVLSFAAWLTLHLTLLVRLMLRTPRWRSLLALLPPLAPLAPYWAWREGMKKSALLWGLLFALYCALLVLGYAL